MGRATNGARMLTSVRHRGPISRNGVQVIGRAYRNASKSGRDMKKAILPIANGGATIMSIFMSSTRYTAGDERCAF